MDKALRKKIIGVMKVLFCWEAVLRLVVRVRKELSPSAAKAETDWKAKHRVGYVLASHITRGML